MEFVYFSLKLRHYPSVGQIDVIIDVDIKAEVKIVDFFAGIVHIKLQVCKTEFKVARIICPSHLLVRKVEPVVTTILAASLHKSLCTVVELVIDVARVDFLHTTNVLVSVGTVATIQYQLASLPVITSSYFAVELNMIIRAGGRFITVPVSSVPVGVPSLLDNALSLGITQASLNTILSVVIQIHVQEFICTPQVFSAADELTDAIAVLLSHQKCPKCPGKSPLKISITLVGAKRVILEPKRAILELSVEIGVSVKGPSGALIRLFVLKANLKLSTQASVHDRKLFFTTKLVSLELTLVSSEVGPIEVSLFSFLLLSGYLIGF
ncbi:uncharacterized protein LOC133386488 [Rhineura floridana]|uniref:uncharacterized protein LOC133386488 n=1 Tax=Rhineura floridana TaxID=261503 RepID=UPI002AC85105|nr:uncharacterized protein LOC133386488 [Rhineura floridana]